MAGVGGSKPGERRGGRQKGTPNKLTVEREIRAAHGIQAALETGVLPLDVMLKVMRGGDEGEAITDRQLQAAISAAPYVHSKLSTLRGDSNAPLNVNLTGVDIERRIHELLAKGRGHQC